MCMASKSAALDVELTESAYLMYLLVLFSPYPGAVLNTSRSSCHMMISSMLLIGHLCLRKGNQLSKCFSFRDSILSIFKRVQHLVNPGWQTIYVSSLEVVIRYPAPLVSRMGDQSQVTLVLDIL